MKKKRRALFRLTLRSLVVVVLAGVPTVALEIATHALVNQRAVDSWTYVANGITRNRLDQLLRDVLGYRDGTETALSGRPVQEWIDLGGELEDQGSAITGSGRFYNHFHDPLQPWNAAGLTFLGPNESSVRWMQNPNQDSTGAAGGNWSWHDARRMYYQALTEPDSARREALLAATFRALGQIMHLVVDASNPDHVRDDEHWLASVPFLGFWNYDKWVQSQHGASGTDVEGTFVTRFLSNPIGPDPDIFQIPIPGNEPASVPVARLIDSDAYNGSNPSVTFNAATPTAPVAIGLAEIANANFFSEDTLRGPYPPFPLPGTDGLIRTELLTPRQTPDGRHIVRRYWTRPEGQGLLPANPLRAECASGLTRRVRPYPCVDDVVWNQVAAHMLPRAVGYARGVLEYFFRGSVAIAGVRWTSGGVTVDVKNTGTEEMEGVFEIYARHQPNTELEQRVKLATLEEGAPMRIGPGQLRRVALPVPPDATPTATYTLVFRGRLGIEEDAVVGQVFTVPYVEVRQATYDADVTPSCTRPPGVTVTPPYLGTTPFLRLESMRCEWRVFNHRVSGTLETNAPHDPDSGRRESVIDRIEARWIGGDVRGPAPLTLDGESVGSVWQRQGTEPDPVTFTIVDPTDRSRSFLYLLVTYTNGEDIEVNLAIFTKGVSVHGKQIVLDNRDSSMPEYLVISSRSVSGLLAYNSVIDGEIRQPLFVAISHGGVAEPTDSRRTRFFAGSRAFFEGLLVESGFYADDVIDDFEVFSVGDAAFGFFDSIEPLLGPHPDGPSYAWDAEIRREYQPIERDFLRAFVNTNPEPFLITLTGAVVGD
jgi:hypothetical protein